jgi:hypothetical protein
VGVVYTGARKYKTGFDQRTIKRVQALEGELTMHNALMMEGKAIWVRRVPLTYVCKQAGTRLQPLERSS